MTIRTKLVAGVSALAFTVAGVLIATPAEAATLDICNYSGSDDSILAYRISSPFQEWMISPGNCAATNNTGGAVRVDVDPSGGSADIDSWRKYRIPGNPFSYPCYNNEDGASNPYNDADNGYWTHAASNCSS